MNTVLDTRPSLRDRKKDATRQLLEDVAWELFSTQGFDGTTVQQIAERANVAPRTFFRYFPSKEAVLYPEIDGFLDLLEAAFAQRPDDEPTFAALLGAMDDVNERMDADTRRQMERHDLLKRSGLSTSSQFVHDRVAQRIADMVRTKYVSHPDVELRAQLVASVTSAVLAISTDAWLSKGAQGDVDEEAHRCFDLLRSMIG